MAEQQDPGRPHQQRHDAHANQTWRVFLGDLCSQTNMDEPAAARAATSVLCHLEERLTADEVKDLESQLPVRMQELLRDGKDRLLGKLAECSDDETAAETAVWNVFARAPADEEREGLTAFLAQRGDRPAEARKQLLWALLTSGECRFNY